MAAVYRNPRLLVDAERRAEQRELGIVDRERIAGEHGVDPAAPDQLDEVIRPAGVNDHRTSDEDDWPAARPGLAHQRRDFADADLYPPLRRDLVRHEHEIGAVALPELGRDTQALHAADHAIASANLAQLATDRTAVVEHDHGVHALMLNFRPTPFDANLGAHVRCRIEIVGHTAIAIGNPDEGVVLLDGGAAKRHEVFDQTLQRRFARCRDLEGEAGEVVVGAPDLKVHHFERAATLDDDVEDRVENLRIDEVAARADDGGVLMSVWHLG